jgi:hypothetical protein
MPKRPPPINEICAKNQLKRIHKVRIKLKVQQGIGVGGVFV